MNQNNNLVPLNNKVATPPQRGKMEPISSPPELSAIQAAEAEPQRITTKINQI